MENVNEFIAKIEKLNAKKPDEHIVREGGSNPQAAIKLVENGNIIAAVSFLDGLCEAFAEGSDTIHLYKEAKDLRAQIKDAYGVPEHTWSWSKYHGRRDSYEEWEKKYVENIDKEIVKLMENYRGEGMSCVTSFDEGKMVKKTITIMTPNPNDLSVRIVVDFTDGVKIKHLLIL